MKTLEQIKRREDEVLHIGNSSSDKTEKNRCRKELRLLRLAKIYIETGPSEDSVMRQLAGCELKTQSMSRQFNARYPRGCTTKQKSKFMNELGLSDVKKQVELLKYLL